MRRDTLDPSLDLMFASHFADSEFLCQVAQAWAAKNSKTDDDARYRRLEAQVQPARSNRIRASRRLGSPLIKVQGSFESRLSSTSNYAAACLLREVATSHAAPHEFLCC